MNLHADCGQISLSMSFKATQIASGGDTMDMLSILVLATQCATAKVGITAVDAAKFEKRGLSYSDAFSACRNMEIAGA